VFLIALAIFAAAGFFVAKQFFTLASLKQRRDEVLLLRRRRKRSGDSRKRLDELRALLEEQTPWPLKNVEFKAMVGLAMSAVISVPLLAGIPKLADWFGGIWIILMNLLYALLPSGLAI
jgi:hypothetical protein